MKKLVSLLALMSLVLGLGTSSVLAYDEGLPNYKAEQVWNISGAGLTLEQTQDLEKRINDAKTRQEVDEIVKYANDIAAGTAVYKKLEAPKTVVVVKPTTVVTTPSKPADPKPFTHSDSYDVGAADALNDYKAEAIIAVESSKLTEVKQAELVKKINEAKTIEEVKKTVASIKELEALNKVLNNVKPSETSSLDTLRAETIAEIKGLTNITAAMKAKFEELILKSNDEKRILELAKMARSYVAPAPGSVTASVPANAGGPTLPDAGVNDNLSFFALSSLATATYFILKRKA